MCSGLTAFLYGGSVAYSAVPESRRQTCRGLLVYEACTFCHFFLSRDTRKVTAKWMLHTSSALSSSRGQQPLPDTHPLHLHVTSLFWPPRSPRGSARTGTGPGLGPGLMGSAWPETEGKRQHTSWPASYSFWVFSSAPHVPVGGALVNGLGLSTGLLVPQVTCGESGAGVDFRLAVPKERLSWGSQLFKPICSLTVCKDLLCWRCFLCGTSRTASCRLSRETLLLRGPRTAKTRKSYCCYFK